MKPWKVVSWVIPPAQNSQFVAQMEQVLDVYKRPYDKHFPIVCMDESPKQMIKETRIPIPMKPGSDAKVDFEYERCGVANIFADFALANHNNEGSVKELTINGKASAPVLWIDDENYLTCREVEIMERLSKGWLNKEIADDLGLKFNTVRNHLQNIYHKLGVGNRSEAIIAYLKNRDKYKKLSSDE